MSLESPSHFSQQFLSCTQECYLHQHVTSPTRFRPGDAPSTLDLIFSSEEGIVQDVFHMAPLGHSDHSCLLFTVSVQKLITPPSSIIRRDVNKGDYNKLRVAIGEADWSMLESCDVESHWRAIVTKVNQVTEECLPLKPKKKMKNLYMNREGVRLRRKKSKAYAEYSRSENEEAWKKYTKIRNKLRKWTRMSRSKFEAKIVDNAKHEPKLLWKYVNSRLKSRAQIEDLLREDGSFARTSLEKAEELNRFFATIFTDENKLQVPELEDRSDGVHISTVNFDAEDIEERLKHLNPSKSPGPDGILPRVLKESAEQLSHPLKKLFQSSMEQGIVPKDWKVGHITAIFKKGKRYLSANYRPVSLTSIICKVMEGVIRDKLVDHLLSHGLSEHQHGFVHGRSCALQLLTVLNQWTEMLDNGKPVDVMYMDFAKAFDSVPHERLLQKLSAYGISGTLLSWIRDFLTGRRQRVVVDGAKSDWKRVNSGVPQGSVLGPVLFLAYINDLPEAVSSSVKIFADDTKVFRVTDCDDEVKVLQRDIDALMAWSTCWQLPFNIQKCKVMHLGYRNSLEDYKMEGASLQCVSNEKDLGVVIDSELNFHLHTAQVVAKSFKMLGVIKRSFEKLDEETVPLLFKSLIRPILEYGNCVWGPMYRGDQDAVERVLRRATKLVKTVRHLPYEERLKKLGLMSMYYRRNRGDMIMTYQIITGKLRIKREDLFTLTDSERTRGHCLKLRKPQVSSVLRQHSFPVRVVNPWNSLPQQVTSAPTVNTFKNRLDKHWHNKMYQVRPEN